MNMLLPLLLFDEDDAEADGDRRRKRGTDDDQSNDETEEGAWVRKKRSADTATESDSSLKTLFLLQTMSEGNNGLDINSMMPF